jgi:hypothetical protein
LLCVTGVALVGACGSPTESGGSSAKPEPAEHSDRVRDRALKAEADLLAQYDAVLAVPSVAADSGLTAKLTAIRAEHSAHVAAMKDGYAAASAPSPSATGSSASPSPSNSAPTDAKTAVAMLAKAEQDAASARTTDILATDGTTAMLLASIAASESGHAALLLGGAV